MRRLAASLAVAALLATTSASTGGADDAAIRQVIGDQITAFEKDDFAAAFDFASRAIRDMFGTPERFGRMVRQGYPMVHRPAELLFLETRPGARAMLQRVLVTDGAGRVHLLEYEMVEADGRYLINGVRILRGADAGV